MEQTKHVPATSVQIYVQLGSYFPHHACQRTRCHHWPRGHLHQSGERYADPGCAYAAKWRYVATNLNHAGRHCHHCLCGMEHATQQHTATLRYTPRTLNCTSNLLGSACWTTGLQSASLTPSSWSPLQTRRDLLNHSSQPRTAVCVRSAPEASMWKLSDWKRPASVLVSWSPTIWAPISFHCWLIQSHGPLRVGTANLPTLSSRVKGKDVGCNSLQLEAFVGTFWLRGWHWLSHSTAAQRKGDGLFIQERRKTRRKSSSAVLHPDPFELLIWAPPHSSPANACPWCVRPVKTPWSLRQRLQGSRQIHSMHGHHAPSHGHIVSDLQSIRLESLPAEPTWDAFLWVSETWLGFCWAGDLGRWWYILDLFA